MKITELKKIKADFRSALISQGIDVPDTMKLEDYPKLVGGMVTEQRHKIDELKTVLGTVNKEEVEAIKEKSTHVDNLGGIKQIITQSDKLGQDWVEEYIGEKLIRKIYKPQENPVGVADNPFVFENGCSLIPNAFYTYYDGEKYVWMGDYTEDASIDVSTNEMFVKF